MIEIPFINNDYLTKYYILNNNYKKISLYTGTDVNYELITDGIITLEDIRIDKRPHYHDNDLLGITPLKRYDFYVENTSIILIRKEIVNLHIQDFYLSDEYLKFLLSNKKIMYVDLTFIEKDKIKVKILGK